MSVDRAFARAYADMEVAQTERSEFPVAVIVVTQPGSLGPQMVREHLHEQLQLAGGYVMADTQTLESRLPQLRDADGGVDRGQRIADIKLVERETESAAVANRRNLVVDSAGRSSSEMLELTSELHRAGYRVELHALAVNDQIIYERAMSQYETARSRGEPGVLVDKHEHDSNVREGSNIVRRLEYAGAVDKITVYNRLNDVVLEHKPVPGRIVAGEAFDRARVQLSPYERVALAEKWDVIVEQQEARFDGPNAETDRLGDVELQFQRAHYTLHSSKDALESYRERNPGDERDTSDEAARRYGDKLVAAFRDSDRAQADALPELANAFTAMAAGARAAGGDQGTEAALRDRITAGLRQGVELKEARISEASLFTEQQQLMMAGRKGMAVTGLMEYDGKPVSHLMFMRDESAAGTSFRLDMLNGDRTVETRRGVKDVDLAKHVGRENAHQIRTSDMAVGTLMGSQLHYNRSSAPERTSTRAPEAELSR